MNKKLRLFLFILAASLILLFGVMLIWQSDDETRRCRKYAIGYAHSHTPRRASRFLR